MQVTDEMVWRIVNLDPNYFSEDQARAMLEHVLGGEPEQAPQLQCVPPELVPQVLAAVKASVEPPSEEERLRNLRVNLAAELYTEESVHGSPEYSTTNPEKCAAWAFTRADAFIAEWKRREGK